MNEERVKKKTHTYTDSTKKRRIVASNLFKYKIQVKLILFLLFLLKPCVAISNYLNSIESVFLFSLCIDFVIFLRTFYKIALLLIK